MKGLLFFIFFIIAIVISTFCSITFVAAKRPEVKEKVLEKLQEEYPDIPPEKLEKDYNIFRVEWLVMAIVFALIGVGLVVLGIFFG